MKELFKKWLEKLACRHEWTIIAKTSYTDFTSMFQVW